MTNKRKIKVIASVLPSVQNSLAYPECHRRERDTQKENLNKKLNRIIVTTNMEIVKQKEEFDQRFKIKLDDIDREMRITRQRLTQLSKRIELQSTYDCVVQK